METLRTGDRVRAKIAWKNTGSERHRFILGYTIRHIDSKKDYDLPLEKDSTSAGKRDDKKSDWWTIPITAPKGKYSIISAVWEGEKNGIPFNRLDDEVIANAFKII